MSWGRKAKAADGPEPSAYQRALGLLVRREHSRKELGRKLVAKGVEREDLDLALDKLRRQDFQNDARFAAALARSRSSSGYGPARIRAELAQHGLAREDIGAAEPGGGLFGAVRCWPVAGRGPATGQRGRKTGVVLEVLAAELVQCQV